MKTFRESEATPDETGNESEKLFVALYGGNRNAQTLEVLRCQIFDACI